MDRFILEENGVDVDHLDLLCDEIKCKLQRLGFSLDQVDIKAIDSCLYSIHCRRFSKKNSYFQYSMISTWRDVEDANIDNSLFAICTHLLPPCKRFKDEENNLRLIVRTVLEERLSLNADLDSIVCSLNRYRFHGYSCFFEYNRRTFSAIEKLITWRWLPVLYVVFSIIVGFYLLVAFNNGVPFGNSGAAYVLFPYALAFPLLFFCFGGEIDNEKKAKMGVSICEFGLTVINLFGLCGFVIWCSNNLVEIDISSGLGFVYASFSHLLFGLLSLFFAKRFGFLLSLLK